MGDEIHPGLDSIDVRREVLCLRLQARIAYTGHGGYYPPIPLEQLDVAEDRLGVRLPTLLRQIYTTVANGGEIFGDGHDLYAISGANIPEYNQSRIWLVEDGGERLDDATVAALRASPGAYVARDAVPAEFLTLANLGCAVGLWLDVPTGQLFASDNVREESGEEKIGLSFYADSLDEWVEGELARAPFGGGVLRQPLHPLAHMADTPTSSPSSRQADAAEDWWGPSEDPTRDRGTRPPAEQAWRAVHAALKRQQEQRDRMERWGRQLRRMREETVEHLNEAAAIGGAVAAEVGEANVAKTVFDGALRSLADAEAQLYEAERLVVSGLLIPRM